MICSICGQAEATIHLTEILNNQMVEIHLCETCAEQKGTDFKSHFNFNKLLASLADLGTEIRPEHAAKQVCRTCGMTPEDFARTGRLGCANCYRSFEKLLVPILKRVQRDLRHAGKIPEKAPGTVKRAFNLRELHDRLRKSVLAEEFEEAAKIRDQIRTLEEKMKKENKEGKKSKS